jgi:hypothetical protein
MLLFPPVAREHWNAGGILGVGSAKKDSQFVGYGFLFTDRFAMTVEGRGSNLRVEYGIDWPILLLQWLAVAALTWAATRLPVCGPALPSGPAPNGAAAGRRLGLLGPALLVVGLVMSVGGCAGCMSEPRYENRGRYGPPPDVCCAILGIPLVLFGGGICIGRSVYRGGG